MAESPGLTVSVGPVGLPLFGSSVLFDPLPGCSVRYWERRADISSVAACLFSLFCQSLRPALWASAVRCGSLIMCCAEGLALSSSENVLRLH